MSERDIQLTVFGKRLPPDVEKRVDEAVETFRKNHRHPANLALHAVGYYAIAKGALRFIGRKKFRGLLIAGVGVGLLLAGHEIEGTPAFAALTGNGKVG